MIMIVCKGVTHIKLETVGPLPVYPAFNLALTPAPSSTFMLVEKSLSQRKDS
jgi:hypothetical protein